MKRYPAIIGNHFFLAAVSGIMNREINNHNKLNELDGKPKNRSCLGLEYGFVKAGISRVIG